MNRVLRALTALLVTGSFVLAGHGLSSVPALAHGSSAAAHAPAAYTTCQAPNIRVGVESGARLASKIAAPPQPRKKVSIVVLIPNGGDPYFQNKSYGYIKAAQRYKNVSVQLFDAGGYGNITKQISQMEDAIQRHVSAIILTATSGSALAPAVAEAVKAHIPVVNDDVLVNSNLVATKDSEDSVNVGFHEAYFIACSMHGKGNVVMLEGPPGADISIARAKGAKMAFARFPGIHIVAQQFAQSNIVDATNLMENFIQAHHNIGGVYNFGAVTAFGAVQALKSSGLRPGTKGWPAIATIDLHQNVIKAMQNKEIMADIPAEPVRLASTSVILAIKLAEGQKVPRRVYTGSEIPLTLGDLNSFDKSLALAPPGWKPPMH